MQKSNVTNDAPGKIIDNTAVGNAESTRRRLRKLLPLAVLPLVLALLASFWLNLSQAESIHIYSQNGIWDLREHDFSSDAVFHLIGPAEIIPNALLSPDEFAERADEIIYLQYHEGAATSRLRILFPDDGWYALARISVGYNYRLYINGDWVMELGQPALTAEDSRQQLGQVIITVQPIDGVVEIIQQASNFVHRVSGNHDGWYTGISHYQVSSRITNYGQATLMGAFLLLFLIFMILYFLLSRQRSTLYFALLSFTWFLRLGVMFPDRPAPFTSIFPWFSWALEMRIEYIAMPATAILMMLITNALFPNVVRKYFRYLLYVVSVGYMLAFSFVNTYIMSVVLLQQMQIMYVICILYVTVCFILRVRKVNLQQGIFLAGISLFFYFVMAEFLGRLDLAWLPLFVEEGMSNIIVLMFSICTAASVFVKSMDAHLSSEAQKQELEIEKRNLLRFNAALETSVKEKTASVVALQNAIVSTMAELVEYRDEFTGGHILRVQKYVGALMNAMKESGVYADILGTMDEDLILQSCQLHDVGKISISDTILLKPGKLTPEEFEKIKTHALFGEKVICSLQDKVDDSQFLEYAREFAVSHHERWDGTGYPHGLADENIPLLGRMAAIADVYDALVSVRPYKDALPHEEAVKIILDGRGSHFDPALVDLFEKIHPEFERITMEIR